MELDEIYKKRFNQVEGRKHLWQILVTNFFQRYIKATDVVLDMPCGYSEFINNVSCKKKIGLDLNPDSAKYIAEDVDFLLAPSTAIPLKDRTVDVIFISNFFEHLSHDDLMATIRESYRVLRPGGRVMVLQPNIRFAFRDYWMFLDHATPIDDRMLEEAFELSGFTLTKRILRFLPFTAKSRLPQHPIFVRTYLRVPLLWRIFGKQTFMIFER